MLKLIFPKGYDFSQYDYGTPVAFVVYNEDDSAFDGSSYSGYVEISNEAGMRVISEIPTSQVSSSGAGTFSFTSLSLPVTSTSQGYTQFYASIRLEKAGIVLTTERRKISIYAAPGT